MGDVSPDPLLFEGLFESAPDGLLIVDGAGRILRANHEAQQLFGWGESDFVGLSVEQLLPDGPARDRHVKHRAHFAANPVARPMGTNLDLWAKRKDGSTFAVDISLAQFHANDGPLVIATVRDISARKAMEANLRNQITRAKIVATASNAFLDVGSETDAILDSLSRQIATDLDGTCGMFLLNDTDPQLRCVAWHTGDPATEVATVAALTADPLRVDDEDIATVLSTGKTLTLSAVDAGDSISRLGSAEGTMITPIRGLRDTVTGVVICQCFAGREAHGAGEIEFIESVAHCISLGIVSSDLNHELAEGEHRFRIGRAPLAEPLAVRVG